MAVNPRPPARCHPERPHAARGMCRMCYQRWWKSQRRARDKAALPARRCKLCRARFVPESPRRLYCSGLCGRVGYAWARAARAGTRPENEELYATRDAAFARELARTCRDRGLKRIAPNGAGASTRARGYYSAWRREGGLYLLRVSWPSERLGFGRLAA